MPRAPRQSLGGVVYHVLNRSNARSQIFESPADYAAFEKVLGQARLQTPMRILTYCIMPNHWHLVLRPHRDGDLPLFMRWLTMTHTQRWHAAHRTIGTGHLYQGRYKSFPVETDDHLLRVCLYVERNPVRARLVSRAEHWRHGSLWRKLSGDENLVNLLSEWPTPPPSNYLELVNQFEDERVLARLRDSAHRGWAYGSIQWCSDLRQKEEAAAQLR